MIVNLIFIIFIFSTKGLLVMKCLLVIKFLLLPLLMAVSVIKDKIIFDGTGNFVTFTIRIVSAS